MSFFTPNFLVEAKGRIEQPASIGVRGPEPMEVDEPDVRRNIDNTTNYAKPHIDRLNQSLKEVCYKIIFRIVFV